MFNNKTFNKIKVKMNKLINMQFSINKVKIFLIKIYNNNNHRNNNCNKVKKHFNKLMILLVNLTRMKINNKQK